MPSSEVMHKFGRGELHSGGPGGPAVHNQKQAVAIMLSEKRKEAANGGVYPEKKAEGGPVVNKGAKSEVGHFAAGGAVQDRSSMKDFNKADPQSRGDYGRFLGSKDRFSDKVENARVANARQSQETVENWLKTGGTDDISSREGDDKSEKAVKPRGKRHSGIPGG